MSTQILVFTEVNVSDFLYFTYFVTLSVFSMQLDYFSSGTGFYFIYDFCLSSHLTTIHSYLLRYIPVMVASLVYILIRIIRYVCLQYVYTPKTKLPHIISDVFIYVHNVFNIQASAQEEDFE